MLRHLIHSIISDGCNTLGRANGYVTYNKNYRDDLPGYPKGTVATFQCNNGFQRTGASTTTCQNNAKWKITDGHCGKSSSVFILQTIYILTSNNCAFSERSWKHKFTGSDE